jgi:hypothetical protein
MADIKFEIEEEIAVLSNRGSWYLELNRVSWNGAPAKFDIRTWNDTHTRMGKGITLTDEEAKALMLALQTELEDEE